MALPESDDIPAPLALFREAVRPEWIDCNGHMNVAYYVLAFDHATDAFFDWLGIGEAYLRERNCSTFTLEAHVTYEREVHAGAPLAFTTRLIDFDAKRIRYIHLMYHADEGYLAASNELLSLHVDMARRRSAPLPDGVQARLARLKDAHDRLPPTPQAGRKISLARH
ncbi:MAG: thioesterase-like protein [Alphaproteobacteria bacterium]|nr:thioesterase-like protein [Alphaproteobacteria bacterium]